MTTIAQDYPEYLEAPPRETMIAVGAPLPTSDVPAAIVYDLPAQDYFAAEGLSFHGALKLLKTPAHYRFDVEHPKESTPDQIFGQVVHCGVLEPDRFSADVIAAPTDAPKRPTSVQINAKKPSPETLAAIAFWRDFNAAAEGKIVLPAAEYDRAIRCIQAVRAHPGAARLLAGATTEVSLFWRDAEFGIPCKARIDAMSCGGNIDLKTTNDAGPEGFGIMVARNSWNAQGAHYASGAEHVLNESPRFHALIAVEDEEPHAVAVYVLDVPSLLAGQHLMRIAAERYREARQSGKWKAYPDLIQTLHLPKWALRFDA